MATNARPIGEFTLAIAAEIRSQRSRRKIAQPRFVELAEIPLSTLSALENGRAAIDAEQIARIAAAFNMAPDEFIASAIANSESYTTNEPREVGPLVTSRGSVTARSTDEEHADIEEWVERRPPAPGSNTPNQTGADAIEDR